MLIQVQWSTLSASGFLEFDHTDWRNLAKKNDPTSGQGASVDDDSPGWICEVACQGVRLTGGDYYFGGPHPTNPDGCVIGMWTEADQITGVNRAWVWEFEPPGLDQYGQMNTRQKLRLYLDEPDYSEWMARGRTLHFADGSEVPPYLWVDFSPPASPFIRYGITMSDELYQQHRANAKATVKGWRDWIG